MKKLFSILMLFALMLTTVTAQKLNYQLVIRNGNQQLVTNRAVTANVMVKVGGTSVYDTTINATTNAQGLLDIRFGNASLTSLDWPNATMSVQVTDVANSTVYMPHADLQVSAVPYALYSANGNGGGSGLYFLTFDANTGAGSMNAQIFPVGIAQSVMYNGFTKAGHTFAGWNTSAAGTGTGYTEGQSATLTENTLVYAQWTVNHYSVNFHNNGGTGDMAAQDFTYGVPQALTSCTMSKTGYHFDGWNTASDGTGAGYADRQSISASRHLDLYAQWAPDSYTVRFIANNGTDDTTYQTFYRDRPQNLSANGFSYAGHNFADWTTAADGTGTGYSDRQTVTLTSDLTLYARWTTIPTFRVTFNANGGTGTMSDQIFLQGVPQALDSNRFTRTGCTFVGWNTNANGLGAFYTDRQEVTLSATTTLYAKWDGSGLVNDTTPTYCNVTSKRSNETGTETRISAVRDHQMNSYRVVQIGEQCWLKENMRATTSPSTGTNILQCPAQNMSWTGKRAYYPNDSVSIAARMGVLYNWNAAVDTFNTTYGETSYGTNSGNAVTASWSTNRRGICPEGWHVPNELEWASLSDSAGINGSNSVGKLVGGNDWIRVSYVPVSDDDVPTTEKGLPSNYDYAYRNQSGFSAVPAGCYGESSSNGYFYFGQSAFFGMYSHSTTDDAEVIGCNSGVLEKVSRGKNKGFSVRCVRDAQFEVIPCQNFPTVSDYDGNEYNTVQIGNQCWMRENLRTTHYSNGTAVGDRLYPGNDSSNVEKYGYLYGWGSAMNGAGASDSIPSNVQGICPTGWHLPSNEEWEVLVAETNSANASGKLSTGIWLFPMYDYISSPGNYGYELKNQSGFSALAAGYYSGSFYNIGDRAVFLSTSSWEKGFIISGMSNQVGYYKHLYVGTFYESVRCLKD